MVEKMDAAYHLVGNELRTAVERHKRLYDLPVRPAEFLPRDRVHYYSSHRYQGRSSKWQQIYQRSFIVVNQGGPVNHRLRKTKHFAPFVTHVDKLRPCLFDGLEEVVGPAQSPPLPVCEVSLSPQRITLPCSFSVKHIILLNADPTSSALKTLR